MSNEIAPIPQGEMTSNLPSTNVGNGGVFNNIEAFENAQRIAKALSSSALVPEAYRGEEGVGSTLIALDMANRTNANPVMIMQNLNVIHGRPSWGSKFVIAALNTCGRFSPLEFEIENLGEKTVEYEETVWKNKQKSTVSKKITVKDKRFVAFATDLRSGKRLEGAEVTIEMAVQEGWYTKKGSKWRTMPDLMGRYRAASFFGSFYAPDILMGMPSADEAIDIGPDEYSVVESVQVPDIAAVNEAEQAESEPPKKKAGRPTKAQVEAAHSEGMRAYHAGSELDDVPAEYTVSSLRKAWAEGWNEGKAQSVVVDQVVKDEQAEEVESNDPPFDLDNDGETDEVPPLADDTDDFGFEE